MSLPAAVTQGTQAIKPCQKFEGHTHWVLGVTHLPGGQRIMTCSDDGSLRVWDLQTGNQIATWRDGESAVIAMALSSDGKKVVSGSRQGAVSLWNIDTGKVITKWMGHERSVESVSWNRDDEQIMSGCHDGTVRVWDGESGKTVLEIETGLNEMWTVVYSPDTTMIATGGDSEEKEFIKIWDANTGKLLINLKGHTKDVTCLTWTAEGGVLISSSFDYSIRTWNTTTWHQMAVLTGHTDFVFGIAISPNGRILASSSYDHTARLWNLDNGQPICSPLQHPNTVTRVSFSTGGKLLATGCSDGNAYSWDISVIVREAGLDELLSNPNDSGKSLLDANATQCPGRRYESARPPHHDCFGDSPHHPDPSRTPLLSAHHDKPPRPRFLGWVRNPSFSWPRRRNDESVGLRERRQTVVNVPLGQGKPLYYSAEQARVKEEKKNAKNASTSTSRSSQKNVTQRSSRMHQAQPSEPRAVISTLSTTPAVVATPTAITFGTSLPDAIIPRAGCWTRFWLFICCTSVEYPSYHH